MTLAEPNGARLYVFQHAVHDRTPVRDVERPENAAQAPHQQLFRSERLFLPDVSNRDLLPERDAPDVFVTAMPGAAGPGRLDCTEEGDRLGPRARGSIAASRVMCSCGSPTFWLRSPMPDNR